MSRTVVSRKIGAPVARVFRTVADIREFSKAVPDIVGVEFLSERRSGDGTRFRETRKVGGREASTELEVIEYVEDDRVRLVSDAGGTQWDSVFTVVESDGGTVLELVMEARPYRLLARITTPLMKRMIQKALEKDMDAVKTYCAAQAGEHGSNTGSSV